MSLPFLLGILIFDNPESRKIRAIQDFRASLSFIFESFVITCQECSNVEESVSIDEILVAFHGRCKFHMYV